MQALGFHFPKKTPPFKVSCVFIYGNLVLVGGNKKHEI
ncbi:hypothetical protein CbC4_5065 (plasmid) [Clostridium botulinum BKT015925]|nr:hypothetical protein CbC4_5065 [Clostridium botulinum BKT015925]